MKPVSLFMLLLLASLQPLPAQAHFQNFLARMLYLQEDGDDSLIYLRLPLASLLLPADWEQDTPLLSSRYTRADPDGRPRLDLVALQQQPEQLKIAAARYLQLRSQTEAPLPRQVEALRIQRLEQRTPFGYLPTIERALTAPLQLPARAPLLEEAIIDIKLRLPDVQPQAIRYLASPADEWPLIRTRSVNILTLPQGRYTSAGPLELTLHSPPSPLQTLGQQLRSGVHHVLIGLDHLLFMAVLVLGASGWRTVLHNSLMFTAGHSITLGLIALGWLSLPRLSVPLIETLIALSVLYGCLRLLAASTRALPLWQVAGIGLLHGVGFANVMHNATGLPVQQLLLNWAGFNLGIELGQMVVFGALGMLLLLVQKSGRLDPRQATLALIWPGLAVAGFWTLERGLTWFNSLGVGA